VARAPRRGPSDTAGCTVRYVVVRSYGVRRSWVRYYRIQIRNITRRVTSVIEMTNVSRLFDSIFQSTTRLVRNSVRLVPQSTTASASTYRIRRQRRVDDNRTKNAMCSVVRMQHGLWTNGLVRYFLLLGNTVPRCSHLRGLPRGAYSRVSQQRLLAQLVLHKALLIEP
jgi:hypothetical protein